MTHSYLDSNGVTALKGKILPLTLTIGALAALEIPDGSGLYPSLKNRIIIISDNISGGNTTLKVNSDGSLQDFSSIKAFASKSDAESAVLRENELVLVEGEIDKPGSDIVLYDTTGQNTDGAMTQKATTDELYTKANIINHTPETLAMMDIFNNASVRLLFGLKTLTIADTIDPDNLKDLYVDVYTLISNSGDEGSYWSYLAYDEEFGIYSLFGMDNQPIHVFYDYNTQIWDSQYIFPEIVWDQMIVVDATSSDWGLTDPTFVNDFNDILWQEGLIESLDLEDVFKIVSQGLTSKVEIDQGSDNAGMVMTVNTRGFVVPMSPPEIEIYEAVDDIEALSYSQAHPNAFVFVSR